MSGAAKHSNATDVLKQRGISTVVYFHTDHFEPWRLVTGRTTQVPEALPDLEQFADPRNSHEFGRRATLFYKNNLNFTPDAERALWRADPADILGFVPLAGAERELSRAGLAALTSTDHELQIHIHHENFTWNDRIRVPGVANHLADPASRRFDHARMELAIRINLEVLRTDAGIALDRWFFVHGNWALNAADPHECTIVREIEMLRRNGCLGDFTQPSGRQHTDSRINEPHLVRPVPLAKGYDRPEADPIPAAGAGEVADDRFLIWASQVNSLGSSIDYYSPQVRQRLAEPGAFALAQAREAFAHDGVLYVKTHAHSMHQAYWDEADGKKWPHAHAEVIAELGGLFDAATEAGAAVRFLTTSEVFDLLIGAPPPAARNLAAVVAHGSPMAAIGCDVIFRDAAGQQCPPPVLGWLNPRLPAARPARIEEPGDALPAGPVPDIVLIGPDGETLAPTLLPQSPPPDCAAFAADVVAIDAIAAKIALDQRDALGERSGISGLYLSRAESGSLLQTAELSAAAVLERLFPDRRPRIVELGCGLGLLTNLLARRGWRVTGIDRDARRIALAVRIGAELASATPPRFECATFPDWTRRRFDLADAVALVTNLVGTETLKEQFTIVRGLARFGTVIVDLARFYEHRKTDSEYLQLIAMFRKAGFGEPLPGADLGSDGMYVVFRDARPQSARARIDRLLAVFRR